MHPILFTQAARQELIDAQIWYDGEVQGLGKRFRAEVDTLVERIRVNLRQFPVVYRNVHRALLRRFPYALFFVIQADEIVAVIACFHASRDPLHWKRRS